MKSYVYIYIAINNYFLYEELVRQIASKKIRLNKLNKL